MKRLLLAFLVATAISGHAQISRLGHDIEYQATLQGTAGNGDYAPFWFSNNRYGLGSLENYSGLVRANIHRDAENDSLHNWHFGYGADVVGAVNYSNNLLVQQLYADVQWKILRLSVGQKERPLELRNQELSTGALTTGINARPLPQVRLEIPDLWVIPRTGNWLAMKAHIAYGAYTDNKWQRDFAQDSRYIYTANSLYHSKGGFMRIGNLEKFPVTLTGGFEMSCQFGGEAWNLRDRNDHQGEFDSHQKMNSGLKGFWHALVPGGSDSNDGDFANAEGNQLGSWHARLDYHGKGWGLSFYAEHFFEDHGQMVPYYEWKDMQYGIEANLPKNPFVSTVLYEHVRTDFQSGPIYHDGTKLLPVSIAGMDNYYNHHVYGAWQHGGFNMATPLVISPIYNASRQIICNDNRVRAHHVGISGNPTQDLEYRAMFTYEVSQGRYDAPRVDPATGRFLLVEGTYAPHQIPGLAFTAAYGQNAGDLLGQSKGAMLTISYSGKIK